MARRDETKRFRLKSGVGRHYFIETIDDQPVRREVRAGQVVNLTRRQASAFGDKFEPLEGNFDDETTDREGVVFDDQGNTGERAGTNNTPQATARDGRPGQNPSTGVQGGPTDPNTTRATVGPTVARGSQPGEGTQQANEEKK